MENIEKRKSLILVTLVTLTLVAFVVIRDSRPTHESTVPASIEISDPDEIRTTAGCGHCTSQGGLRVDCDKATQLYTCAAKTMPCKSGSICQ